MANRKGWKNRILRAARDAKQGALAAAKHADALMTVAQQEIKTAARHRKVKKTLKEASRVLKAAGKAALAAAAAAAVGAVAREIGSRRKKLRN